MTRPLLFLTLLAVVLGVYGAEIYASHRRHEAGSHLGEVARRRAAGEDIWPAITPSIWYFDLFRVDIDAGRNPLPLAGLSGAHTAFCNEGQGWVTFRSDRFGFRNPDRQADESYDVALIGDSFVQGSCVSDAETIAGRLKRSGFSTLNLGMQGSGPLFELAVLQEYATRPSLKHVVWFFFEGNDINDLAREAGSGLLRRYLVDDALQGLEQRQAEIDAAFRRGVADLDRRSRWRDIAALREVRTALRLVPTVGGSHANPAVAPHLPLLGEVLDRARRSTESKGATFTVAYLPTPWRYHEGAPIAGYYAAMEQAVGGVVCHLGIDLITMSPVLGSGSRALDRFVKVGNSYAHLNADGYRLVADAVGARLAGRTQSDCPTR